MKLTLADKDATSWSLSWHPDGRCASFTRKAILAHAPATSGVYGLFNFDCQLFIGESANIQETLLRHESETDFQASHLRPTGFTFEACATELREIRAAELVTRFRPLLQREAALPKPASPSNGSKISALSLAGQELETYAADQELPVHEREKHPKARRAFQLKRMPVVVLATFAASALVIFCLGLPADYTIHQRANSANPTSGPTEVVQTPPNAPSSDTARRLTNQGTDPAPAKSEVHASVSTANAPLRFESTPAGDRAGVRAKTNSMARSTENANLNEKWSVQISAVPEKNVAETLAQRLKAKGYAGYVVETNVKGQTYYRVRVGHFDAQGQAESVRQSLARQEGYRDAYLTGD